MDNRYLEAGAVVELDEEREPDLSDFSAEELDDSALEALAGLFAACPQR